MAKLTAKNSALFNLFMYLEKSSRQRWTVFGLAVLLYGVTMFFDYNMDDTLVTQNHRLTSKGISAIPEIISSPYYQDDMGYSYDYRPLVLASFAIEHSIFGEHPSVSHLINTLLYGLLCMVFLQWGRLILNRYSAHAPLIASLLFAAHPLHTEITASIKNRDEIIGLLLVLLASIAAFNAARDNKLWQWLSIPALFFVAMLGKTTVTPFSVIIPLSLVLLTNVRLISAQVIFLILYGIVLGFASPKVLWIISVLALMGITGLWLIYNIRYNAWGIIIGQIRRIELYLWSHLRYLFSINDVAGKADTQFDAPGPFFTYKNLFWLFFYELAVALTGYGFYLKNPLFIFISSLLLLTIHLFWGRNSLVFGLCVFTAIHLLHYFSLAPFVYNSYMPLVLCTILLFIYSRNKTEKWIAALLWLVLVVKDVLYCGTWWWLLILPFSVLYNKRLKHVSIFGCIIYAGVSIWKLVMVLNGEFTDLLIFLTPFLILLIRYLNKTQKWQAIFYSSMFFIMCLQLYSGMQHHSIRSLPQVNIERATANAKVSINNLSTIQTRQVIQGSTDRPLSYVEMPVDIHSPISDRLGIALNVTGRYIQLLLIPYPQSFYYGFAKIRNIPLTDLRALLSLLILVVLSFVALYLSKRNGVISFSLTAILVSLLFFSNLFEPIAGLMADRYLLIPSVGLCILISAILISSKHCHKLTIGLLSFYCILSFERILQWKDPLTLMRHDIKHLEESSQAHNILATNLVRQSFNETNSDFQKSLRYEAITHFRKSLQIFPTFFNVAYDLGRVFELENEPDSALHYFQKAIAIDTTYDQVYIKAGEILFAKGRLKEASYYFEQAIRISPNNYIGYDKLSYLLYKSKNYTQSIAMNRKAIKSIPFILDPYLNIARTYNAMNNKDSALYYINEAQKLSPGNPAIKKVAYELGLDR